MSTKNKVVAVRVKGSFTEWYSPYYKDPYEDNLEYREYYNKYIIDRLPIIGPSLAIGDSEEEFIGGCIDSLAERMSSDAHFSVWDKEIENLTAKIEEVLEKGEKVIYKSEECGDIEITPYTKENLPPPNEKSLELYGEYADLLRERVKQIPMLAEQAKPKKDGISLRELQYAIQDLIDMKGVSDEAEFCCVFAKGKPRYFAKVGTDKNQMIYNLFE